MKCKFCNTEVTYAYRPNVRELYCPTCQTWVDAYTPPAEAITTGANFFCNTRNAPIDGWEPAPGSAETPAEAAQAYYDWGGFIGPVMVYVLCPGEQPGVNQPIAFKVLGRSDKNAR